MAAVDEAAAAAAAAAAATDDGKKGVLLFVLKANKSDGGDLAPGLSKSIPCLWISNCYKSCSKKDVESQTY